VVLDGIDSKVRLVWQRSGSRTLHKRKYLGRER